MSLLGKIAIVTGGGSGIGDAVRQMVEETAASHGRLDSPVQTTPTSASGAMPAT